MKDPNGKKINNKDDEMQRYKDFFNSFNEASETDEVSAIRSPEESIAALKQGEIYARAGAKVISAGYDTIGTLLDIRV